MSSKIQISFKSALVALFIIFVVIPSVLLPSWLVYYQYNTLKNLTFENQFEDNFHLIEMLEGDIESLEIYLQDRLQFSESLFANIELNATALNDSLAGILKNKPVLESLFILGPDGELLSGATAKKKIFESEELVQDENRTSLSVLFANYNSQVTQQNTFEFIKLLNEGQKPNSQVVNEANTVTLYLPISDQNELKGILLAFLDNDQLWSSLHFHKDGNIENVDKAHYYLINRNGEVVNRICCDLDSEIMFVGQEDFQEAYSKALDQSSEIVNSNTFKYGGRFFLLSPLNKLNLLLLTEIPASIIYSRVAGFVVPVVVAVIVLVVLIFLFGIFVLPGLLRPITQLKEALRRFSGESVENYHYKSITADSLFSDFNGLIDEFRNMAEARLDSEKGLRESEENLSLTLECIGDAVIVTDPLGLITRMNSVAEKMTGWKESDALRQPLVKVFKIINSETRNPVENPAEKVIKTGRVVGLANHTALISKNGEEYQIADSAAPIIQDGQVIGVILVFHDVTEEYRLRESVREGWEFLNGLVNDMETMVGVIELDGTSTFVNNTVVQSADLTEEDVIGKKIWDTFWFEGLSESQKKLQEAIEAGGKGERSNLVMQVKMLDSLMWVEFTIHPVFDDHGKVKYLVPEGRNVTERIMAEEELEKNRLLYQTILDNASSLIYIKDFDHRYILANKAVCDMYGLQFKDIIGKNDNEILGLDPAIIPEWDRNFDRVLNERRQIEFEEEAVLKNKKYTFLSTKFVMNDSSGNPFAFCGISADITRRVEAEKSLRSSELRLRQHREQTPIGIIECEESMEIKDWNPGAELIFGYTKDEVVGKKVIDLVIPEGQKQEFLANCMLFPVLKQSQQHFYVNKNSKDEVIYCEWYCAPLFDDDGNLTSLTAEIIDKTTQKEQEDQLRRAQKMDALGKLTGGIAHDFNNILGVVLGYAEMAESYDHLPEELLKYIGEIKTAGERGARLTNKLLAFSRQKRAHSEVCNINDLLLEDKNMLEKVLTSRIRLIMDLDEELWPVRIDKSDLEDAILNMTINSQNAIEGNGQLIISTSNFFLDKQNAAISDLTEGYYVKVDITDTGKGIDPEIKGRIFEPFFTTDEESGNGLGLSQVYGFVHRSSGSIKVDSQLGHGTTFSLYFPRSYDQIETVEETNITDKQSQSLLLAKGKNILVVDDEPALRNLAKEILTQEGFNVLCANDGSHAMDLMQSNKIDLILSDVIMPIMDGYQLVDQVNEKYPDVKIILTSGFTDRRHQDSNEESNERKLLYKPYNSRDLIYRVNEAFS